MNNTTSEAPIDQDMLQEAANYQYISCLLAWSTLACCLLGTCTNIVSLLIFAQPSMSRTPINLLLFGVSFVDLCLCVLAIFVFAVPEFFACNRSSWSLAISTYSYVYIYPLQSATQTADIWLFLVVTYERWNAVCRGSGQMYQSTGERSVVRARQRRKAVIAVLFVVFLSLIYNFVRFYEFRIIAQHDEEKDSTSLALERVLKDDQHPSYSVYMAVYYIALFLLTQFAGPFFLMVLVNGLILRAIYVARRRRRQLLTMREKKEHNTSLMMAILILMFLICHIPAFSLNVIELIDPSWFFGKSVALAFALNDLSNFFIVANAAAGALIYFKFNKSYHDLCVKMFFKRIFHQRLSVERNGTNEECRINNDTGVTSASQLL